MSTTYVRLPILGGSAVPTYANFAALPSASGAGNGALAITLDTDTLYISNGTTWLAIGSGSTVLTIGTIDSQTASANGAVITSNSLVLQSASATVPGLVNNTTQTMSGAKSLTGLLTLTGGITSTKGGARNEVYGASAGAALTTGTDNTLVGYQAGTALTSSNTNVAIGTQALSTGASTGDGNTAVGYQALKSQTSGSAGFNTALGYQAGTAITTGNTNTAFGYQTLNATTGGSGNTAVGQGAFTGSSTVGNSTGVGATTGFQTTATAVTYIGANAGQQSSGNFQVGIGNNSMQSASGSASIGFGTNAGRSSTGANTLYIGDTIQDPTAYAINTVVVASSQAAGANWTQNQKFSGTINMSALTASTAVILDSSKNFASSATTSTELGYVSGVTSAIQTQLNSKQATGNYITALTGDVTASGPGSVAATLATVNGNVGSFGSSTSIPSFTVNGKGLITAASGNVVIAPAGTLTGTTLASNVVTSSLTTVGTIGTGTWNGTTIAVANGGTSLTTLTANNVILGNGSSAPNFVAPSTSGNVLTSNGTTWTSAAPAAASVQIAVFNDTETQGTNGGTFTSGAWQTRVLNTTQSSQSWASLSSNQITLSAGTYFVQGSGTARYVDTHQTRWQNITDSNTTVTGTSEQSGSSVVVNATTSRSFVTGVFTIAGSKVFELQHQCSTTAATSGFGVACNFTSEIYAVVSITKVA